MGQSTLPKIASLLHRQNETPWTKAELNQFKDQLNEEITALEAKVETLTAKISQFMRNSGDGTGDDNVDSAAKALDRDQEMNLMAHTQEMLEQAQIVAQRFSAGTFTTCETCDGPIGKMRLLAFPMALSCIECKQKSEKR